MPKSEPPKSKPTTSKSVDSKPADPTSPYSKWIESNPSTPKPEDSQATHLQPKNPLHGITLEQIVKSLVEHYGWERLGQHIDIKSFNNDPSIKSSLKFLRKTPWAREKVENLYLSLQK